MPPPRKPRREAPKPKLSQDALEGKVPLRTFGELSVLFETKKEKKESDTDFILPPEMLPYKPLAMMTEAPTRVQRSGRLSNTM